MGATHYYVHSIGHILSIVRSVHTSPQMFPPLPPPGTFPPGTLPPNAPAMSPMNQYIGRVMTSVPPPFVLTLRTPADKAALLKTVYGHDREDFKGGRQEQAFACGEANDTAVGEAQTSGGRYAHRCSPRRRHRQEPNTPKPRRRLLQHSRWPSNRRTTCRQKRRTLEHPSGNGRQRRRTLEHPSGNGRRGRRKRGSSRKHVRSVVSESSQECVCCAPRSILSPTTPHTAATTPPSTPAPSRARTRAATSCWPAWRA